MSVGDLGDVVESAGELGELGELGEPVSELVGALDIPLRFFAKLNRGARPGRPSVFSPFKILVFKKQFNV